MSMNFGKSSESLISFIMATSRLNLRLLTSQPTRLEDLQRDHLSAFGVNSRKHLGVLAAPDLVENFVIFGCADKVTRRRDRRPRS